MNINGKNYRAVWYEDGIIYMIDQTKIPHSFEVIKLLNNKEVFNSIKDMLIRGAPSIGGAGCFGIAQYIRNYNEGNFNEDVNKVANYLKSARPTAYDLTHGIDYILKSIK